MYDVPNDLKEQEILTLHNYILLMTYFFWLCCSACGTKIPNQGLNSGPGSGSAES